MYGWFRRTLENYYAIKFTSVHHSNCSPYFVGLDHFQLDGMTVARQQWCSHLMLNWQDYLQKNWVALDISKCNGTTVVSLLLA